MAAKRTYTSMVSWEGSSRRMVTHMCLGGGSEIPAETFKDRIGRGPTYQDGPGEMAYKLIFSSTAEKMVGI